MADKFAMREDRLKAMEFAIRALAAKPDLFGMRDDGEDAGEHVVSLAKVIAEYIADPPTR
jgi:hypothetical protein